MKLASVLSMLKTEAKIRLRISDLMLILLWRASGSLWRPSAVAALTRSP